MEKQFKPVPDVKELKYHGTKDKPDIKIFVSHRIDQDSEIIDNSLYIPVRCGAVYDERENVDMLGDDTGDNISKKRGSFCEYTVMYWAWKNIKADYYGLCHYRRYLSFRNDDLPVEKGVPVPALRTGMQDSMTCESLRDSGLLDHERMIQEIKSADVLTSYEYDCINDEIPDYSIKSTKESWLKYHRSFLQEKHFDLALNLIKEYSPKYYESALEYMCGRKFRGFNCFIMKRDIFFSMCEFMFPIMFAFDSQIDKSRFSETQKRAVGYLGEWLYSIYIYHLTKSGSAVIRETQLICFQNTSKTKEIYPYAQINNIPILLVATDSNRQMLAVTITSIMQNASPQKHYDFIVLYRGYDEDKFGTFLRKNLDTDIVQMVSQYPNASIRYYDPKNELLELDIRRWGSPSIEEQYYVILCAWILKHYEKLIYIDTTMIALHDISELYEINISDYYAGGVGDARVQAALNGYSREIQQYQDKVLRLKEPYQYVSTSVLLVNLKKIRSDFNEKQVIETIKSRKLHAIAPDGFNILYERKLLHIEYKWNAFMCTEPEYYRLAEYIPEETERERSMSEPYILYLLGLNGNWPPPQSKSSRLFWKYARLTPFYEDLVTGAIGILSSSIFDIQKRLGIFDFRTPERKLIDKCFPPNSYRKMLAKRIAPRGSLVWRCLKQIQYLLHSEYRFSGKNVLDINK